MQTLRDIAAFCGSYFSIVFWGWWSLAFLVLGANELSQWLFRKSFPLLHRKRVLIAFLLILVAQAVAYKDLSDRYNDLLANPKSVLPLVQAPYAIPTDEREWPSLTDEQVAAWTKALKAFPCSEIHVLWGSEVQAIKLYHSLDEIWQRLGCKIIAPGGSADAHAIQILTNNGDQLGPVLTKLFEDYARDVHCPVTLETYDDKSGYITVAIPDSPRWPRKASDKNTANKRITRDKLGEFLSRGNKLLDKLGRTSDKPIPANEIDQWWDELTKFARAELGASYVDRLSDSSDVGPFYVDPSKENQEHSDARIWVASRVSKINQFLKEPLD